MLEPVFGEPLAVADCGPERVLVVADYHAGIEVGLRADGVELRSAAEKRRKRLLSAIESELVDRCLFLGDLGDSIGSPSRTERAELRELLSAVTDHVPVTVTKGNHDGGIESITEAFDAVNVVDGRGTTIGSVGFCHGHTWPSASVIGADVVVVGHEHPLVRLEDEVGGGRTERVWLRGRIDPAGFPDNDTVGDRLVVCPAFNERSGGTRINERDEFLSPFLPDGLADGDAYLLDGTRLGPYRDV
ncbi:rpa-associated phosphoesterase [Natronomonas pharaonis DSM 2160]|uniref:Rpa-associated phosphoesterase n=1 Tax=Natronomonas pharaonis (strain ATCC 35678 / DSM 2160 / CIP 103997 / JCM 8858 / NBRC 14720 / NCIMB 2260 / Gabara) TaxID=348780 RepID=A0A1U7EXZ6_NATPD|nr:metallophosphoesterase [Natronomonas pharaonis]CAI50073.1 rpa-associated phosphoesterase [Natronomonas pharaonis DSM 2160]